MLLTVACLLPKGKQRMAITRQNIIHILHTVRADMSIFHDSSHMRLAMIDDYTNHWRLMCMKS
jgi:hypothetical protein